MSRDKPPLGPSLRAIAARERATLGEHPSLDQWAAYQEGKVAAEEAERLRDHLARCPQCAQLLMEWMSFAGPVPPEGARPIPRGEVEAAWKALRPQIQFPTGEAGQGAMPPTGPVGVPAPVRAARARGGLWRLAAAILLVAGGFAVWNQLRPEAPVLQANVGVTDETRYLVGYEPSSKATDTRRGSKERRRLGRETTLPANQEHQLGLPLPEGTQPFESYRLEVMGSPGERRFLSTEIRELVSGMEGSGEGFTLRIEPGALPPGLYIAKTYGLDPGRPEELIASYFFEMSQ